MTNQPTNTITFFFEHLVVYPLKKAQFSGIRRFIIEQEKLHHWTKSWDSSIPYSPLYPVSLRHVTILPSHVRVRFPSKFSRKTYVSISHRHICLSLFIYVRCCKTWPSPIWIFFQLCRIICPVLGTFAAVSFVLILTTWGCYPRNQQQTGVALLVGCPPLVNILAYLEGTIHSTECI
jgi:hypothetical protein